MAYRGKLPRSSYRLGRRLKSSAKARLDYITYLQNGGDPSKGKRRVRFAVISGGGSLSANLIVGVGLRVTIAGGGDLDGRLGLVRAAAAGIQAGGGIEAGLHIVQRLAATINSGGDVFAHLFPPHRVTGTVSAGGTLSAKLVKLQQLVATIGGGGALDGSMITRRELAATVSGGGSVIGDIGAPLRPPVYLGATIGGGGLVEGNIVLRDVDADALIAAMTVAPSAGRETLIRNTIKSLKQQGIWTKLDVLYFLSAHDAQAARLNWKNPAAFALSVVGSPVFTANDGYAGVNPSGYLDSGWNPGTHAVNFKQNDACLFARSEDTGTKSYGSAIYGADVGLAKTFTPLTTMGIARVQETGSIYTNLNTGAARSFAAVAGTKLHGITRFGAGDLDYKYIVNGAVTAGTLTQTPNAPSAYGSGTFKVCGSSQETAAGVFTHYGSARKLQVAGWGANLTDAQVVQLDTILTNYISNASFTFTNAEAAAVVAAMTVKPDNTRKGKIDALVGTLKSQGIWSRLATFYMLHSHERQAARVNWKNPGTFDLTEVGTVNFTVDTGSSMANDTSVYETGFVPATHGGPGVFAQTDMTMFVRAASNAVIASADMGNDNTVFMVNIDASNGLRAQLQNNGLFQKATTTAVGIRAVVKTGPSNVANNARFHEGTSQALISATATDAAASSVQMAVGGQRVTSRPFGSTRVLKTAGWGLSLTKVQIDALDAALTTFYS